MPIDTMIETAVKFLKEIGYSRFLITGSVALVKVWNVNLNRELHDVDILIQGDTDKEGHISYKRNNVNNLNGGTIRKIYTYFSQG